MKMALKNNNLEERAQISCKSTKLLQSQCQCQYRILHMIIWFSNLTELPGKYTCRAATDMEGQKYRGLN
uniref:Uncharacterized protein n=1 Tax=Anguilla anguilla TaxID=7936 RepID=A0A0E9TAZ1_ANGAN